MRGSGSGPRVGFLIGTAEEAVEVRVRGRERPGTSDRWDGNWLRTSVRVRAGAFRGRYTAALRSDDLAAFRDELADLAPPERGVAHLHSTEGWLELEVAVDHLGHLEVTGSATDRPGVGNRLEFALPQLDQTYVPPLIAQLDDLLARFPVVDDEPA